MLRRVASFAAACAAVLATAVPASGQTLYTIVGHGYGHGIGMSQYGSLGFAMHGYSYTQILHHYFTNTKLAPVSTGVSERVLMATGRTHFDISTTAQIMIRDESAGTTSAPLGPGSYRVRLGSTAGRMQVLSMPGGQELETGLVGPVDVIPRGEPFRIDSSVGAGFAGDHWNGWFRVIDRGSSLDGVNVVPMEQYVQGVVPNEMPAGWPTPALRTQAVASRSYAYATRDPAREYDAFPDTRSQMYGPLEHEQASSTAAVSATRNIVVWFGSTIATTFFSSSSGGRTSSEQASWGASSGQPYLVAVSDPFDRAEGRNPYHTWILPPRTPTGLARLFGYHSAIASIDQTVDGPSQRELTLTLHNGSGDHVWSGLGVQSQLGLRSTYFRLIQATLQGPERRIKAGTRITVTGRVWPRPSTAVSFQRRTGTSTTWTLGVARLPLDSEGRFVLHLTPRANKAYRLVLRNGAVSPVIHVTVVP